MNEIVVLCTTDSLEAARGIAMALVEKKLAACVNIVPGLHSIYRWEDKICDDSECLLLIKTHAGLFESLRAKIRQIHPYKVPEIIALPINAGDADYLSWLRAQVRI